MSTTVTAKGQVTIPRAVRDLPGIKPGSKVAYGRDGEIVLRRADGEHPPGRFEALRGHAGPGPSTDESVAMPRGDD